PADAHPPTSPSPRSSDLETVAKLDENLPPMWSRGNPVDVLGDARSRRFARAAEIVLADAHVDAVLVILTPQAMTNPTGAAKAIRSEEHTSELQSGENLIC